MTRSTRRHGGRRNVSRKSRGIFGTVYSPVHGVLNVSRKVLRTGLKKGVNIPLGAVKGARNVVSNSVNDLLAGVDSIGHNVFHGADNVVKGVFSRKNRKGSRKNSRRSSRRQNGGRKNSRRNSRKNRKASRKNRRNSRKNMNGGRRRKGSRKNSRKNRKNGRK